MFKSKTTRILVVLAIIASLIFSLAGCSSSTATKTSEFQQVLGAAAKYATSGKAPTVSAKDVYDKIVVGGDPSYFLISLQSPQHYEKGHVKGAINIPYADFWKKENIAKIPKDKKIITICYTGHTASQAAMLLNMLGYEAYAMKYGMMGWTSNPDILGIPVFTKAANYPVVTGESKPTGSYALPEIKTGKTNTNDIILARAEAYLTAKRPPTIDAKDVYDKIVMGNDPSYFLLSVRATEHDAKGHVKGAVTIPFKELFKEENLKKIPKDKKIVVICYTGHLASYTTMALNLLGYETYAMKYGMMAWTDDPNVLNQAVFTKAEEFPTVAGPNPK
ncbi:MAG: rhodanese-like domain-containing protein [Firmicutes bacterium]|nr:rhodanese-like domain-containing protein [Bacillota bacterium]MCL5040289.1 rhodanese-like domain-containing protein [Bacillota bacterium]